MLKQDLKTGPAADQPPFILKTTLIGNLGVPGIFYAMSYSLAGGGIIHDQIVNAEGEKNQSKRMPSNN